MIIYQMLSEQNPQLAQPSELDHISPQTRLSDLRKQYLPHQSKLIQSYLSFKSGNKKDYLANQQTSEEIVQILLKEPIFSARVIFILEYFRIRQQAGILEKVCSNENPIFKRFSKLKGEYRDRYLADIGMMMRKETQLPIRENCEYKNYEFYRDSIQVLHSKKGNYQFLEDKHDYIQWMFPNHYQSMFNSKSYPMSYIEVELFKSSKELGNKMFISILIFLDFMGLLLSPDLQFTVVSDRRLRDVLLVNSHNHLRLRRILACLSITGFRLLALKLIQLLGFIVCNCGPYQRLKRTFQREWQIYGQKDKEQALKLCFHPDDEFPGSHQVLLSFLSPKRNQQILKNKQILCKTGPSAKIQNFYSSSSSSSSSSDKKIRQKEELEAGNSSSQMIQEKDQNKLDHKNTQPLKIGEMRIIPGINNSEGENRKQQVLQTIEEVEGKAIAETQQESTAKAAQASESSQIQQEKIDQKVEEQNEQSKG